MSGKIEKEDKYLLDSTRDEQAIKEFTEKAYKSTGIIQWYITRDENEEERILSLIHISEPTRPY